MFFFKPWVFWFSIALTQVPFDLQDRLVRLQDITGAACLFPPSYALSSDFSGINRLVSSMMRAFSYQSLAAHWSCRHRIRQLPNTTAWLIVRCKAHSHGHQLDSNLAGWNTAQVSPAWHETCEIISQHLFAACCRPLAQKCQHVSEHVHESTWKDLDPAHHHPSLSG